MEYWHNKRRMLAFTRYRSFCSGLWCAVVRPIFGHTLAFHTYECYTLRPDNLTENINATPPTCKFQFRSKDFADHWMK